MGRQLPIATITAAITAALGILPASAENLYVIGLSVAADSADGRFVNGIVDYSFTDATSITVDAGITQAEGDPVDIRTIYWDTSMAHNFGPVGVEASIGQWGDPDESTSNNWSLGLFRTAGPWRFSADMLGRDYELTFRPVSSPDTMTKADVKADGLRAGLSYTADSGAGIFLSASRYDYDRDLTRLNQFRIARLLSPSSLTLSGSLLDRSVSIGGDWPIGERLLSVTVAHDRTAVDRVDVDSVSFGFLTPLGDRSDLDIGVGVSRDGVETQYFLGLLFLFYGGLD